jgi:aspartate kinase
MDTPPGAGKRGGGPGEKLGPAGTMARIVMKFGGTSVADLDCIRNAAKRIKAEYDRGNEVAVTVSAMAGETNRLIGYVRDLAAVHDAREYDVVVSAGEQVTSGLMAVELQNLGVPARSWLGWQLPVKTDTAYGRARIHSVGTDEVIRRFGDREVAVVAGFQGLSPDGRITTLGRGGTDTSAVALAAALQAERCDIYTDVDGVYTSDPRIVAKARKLERVTYEEMLEMASQGAKVLQTRSVELAMKTGVRVQVLSSFNNEPGTLVVDEDEIVEQQMVSGIAYSRDEAKVTLVGVSDRPGVAAGIFGPLADANVNVDMIVQSTAADGASTDITFTVGKADFDRTMHLLDQIKADVGCESVLSDQDVVKISVIGVGMRSHAGVALAMFRTLSEKGINIQVISTSEIKISVLVAEEYTELALRALHTAYGLDAD